MAKERNLPSKSSLTASDFIRVVGSDNASYKQGMSAVAAAINSAQPTGSHTGSIKDWALQTNGQAIVATSPSGTTDLPDSSNKYGIAWTESYVSGNNKWVHLYWSPTNANDIYVCANIGNADNWTAWQKIPTMAEIDANFKSIAGIPASNNINSNDDLNDYTSLGSYACTSGSIATTLVNCPVTGAFRLDVSYGTYSAYVIQDLVPMVDVTNIHWRRTRISGTWGAWTKMPTRAEVNDLNSNRGKISEVITLDNGLTVIGICQQLSSLMDANSGFQCQVFSSGRRYVCGYQYGPKSYGAFLVMTYTGTLEFVWNNNGTWSSKNL